MKTFKKVILLVACAALLVGASVMGTLAYLKAETGPITNTMTVGKVAITLDEAKVTLDGVVDGTARVTENEYKLVPGQSYTKDPQIHVAADSEECYVFVKVVNEIAAIEKQDGNTIAEQLADNGWIRMGDSNVYYKEAPVAAGTTVDVFASFAIANDVANLSSYADKTITITAYAVQSAGFDDAEAAWAAAGFTA